MLKKSIFYFFFVGLFFLIAGCSDNSTKNTDLGDGQLVHPIQCKTINFACDDTRLEKSVQCKGMTAASERCKNSTLNPCDYCYLHTNQAPPVGQCLNFTKNASGCCDFHR